MAYTVKETNLLEDSKQPPLPSEMNFSFPNSFLDLKTLATHLSRGRDNTYSFIKRFGLRKYSSDGTIYLDGSNTKPYYSLYEVHWAICEDQKSQHLLTLTIDDHE